MSAYPTLIYPDPPKLQWWVTDIPKSNSVDLSTATPAGLVRFTSARYQDYLAAMAMWRDAVEDIKKLEHESSLQRRVLEKYKEVVTITENEDEDPDANFEREVELKHFYGSDKVVGVPKMTVKLVKKVPVKPTVSTKKYAEEKREAKRSLSEAKREAKVSVLNQRANNAVPVALAKEEVHREAAKLRASAPLRRAEEVAAKSAVRRSTWIKGASADVVTNVVPEDGWKLVTRKKGANVVTLGSVSENRDESGLSTWTLTGDPANSKASGLIAAVRRPTKTASE